MSQKVGLLTGILDSLVKDMIKGDLASLEKELK